MATLTGSYVTINASPNTRINYIVDNMMTPRLLSFRQVTVYDELATKVSSTVWKLTYPNWNSTFPFIYTLNGQQILASAVTPDYILGTVTMGSAINDGDVFNVTYNIDWFPIVVLTGFIYQALDIINNSGTNSAPTSYDLSDAPQQWDGVIADLAFSMAMEKLMLDYDLWYGRVVFAIGANEMNEGGGGDVISQIESLKQNAEERANISLNNEKFKLGNILAAPTSVYYAAVRGFSRTGVHGGWYGKTRGWKPSRYI